MALAKILKKAAALTMLDTVPSRCSQVNKALRELGVEEELVRGHGYFYFVGGNASSWYTSSVYTYRISDFTIGQWIDEYRHLSGRNI